VVLASRTAREELRVPFVCVPLWNRAI